MLHGAAQIKEMMANAQRMIQERKAQLTVTMVCAAHLSPWSLVIALGP